MIRVYQLDIIHVVGQFKMITALLLVIPNRELAKFSGMPKGV